MSNRVLFLVLATSLVVAGCSKNNSGQSTAPPTSAGAAAAPPNAMLTTTPAASVALMAKLPLYPGATQQVAGNSGGVGAGSASGQIFRSPDSFSKVYAWYQAKMPAHSEKSHMSMAGVETALFVLGSGNSHQTVTISKTAADPQTLVTLAQVSQ
jgi:hypothetical protein